MNKFSNKIDESSYIHVRIQPKHNLEVLKSLHLFNAYSFLAIYFKAKKYVLMQPIM